MSWEIISENFVVNIVPNNDLKSHIESSECECKPKIEILSNGNTMFTHNSFDGRENFEHNNDVRLN